MSVGSALREAREAAGLTVDDIASRTMIRRTVVEQIEADDLHSCGGEFYARGHVKSIAHAMGVDPAPLLAEFDREHAPPDEPTATGVLDPTAAAAAVHDSDRRRPNWTLAMAAALAAVLAFGGFQVLRGGDGSTTDVSASGTQSASAEPTAKESPAESGDESGANETPTGVPSDAIAQASDGVTVVLNATDGRSWVSATGKDSGVLYQSVLNSGREQTFRDDRQVKLVVGNAGAVRLVVNGRDLGSPGGQGEVVRLTFGPGDPTLAGG